jgi:hypothetical protein
MNAGRKINKPQRSTCLALVGAFMPLVAGFPSMEMMAKKVQ